MAQRNPMNKRYEGEGPEGKTRKSAGRAKPKKKPATPTRGKQLEGLSEREKAERKREQGQTKRRMKADAQRTMTKEQRKEQREKDAEKKAPPVVVPMTPEYKKWRNIWMGCLGFAILAIAASWLGRGALAKSPVFMYASIGAAYVGIFAGLAVDFLKMRPLRREAQQKAAAESKSKKGRSEIEKKKEASLDSSSEKGGIKGWFKREKKESEKHVQDDDVEEK